MSLRIPSLLGFLFLVGCSDAPNAQLPSTDVQSSSDTPSSAEPQSSSWRVTAEGVGPVEFGMSADEFVALGGSAGIPRDPEYCVYGVLPAAPQPMRFMIESGTVVRVDVDSTGTATAEGARVGDTEGSIQELYRGRVTVQPHKYTDGHYLIVPLQNDSTRALVFETDGKRVTRYRAGLVPQVHYVEGCS